MRDHTILPTFFGVACVAAVSICSAGDLNPPIGPVAPTHKTLTEVEPRIAVNAANTPGDADSLFKITAPGSYYLTGDITGVAAKHGIEIAAGGVTLDLNGFDLSGVPGMGAFDGVSVTVASLSNIAVVNGSIRNWGGDGVDMATFAASGTRAADLLAAGNTGVGISTGGGGTIVNCSAFQNAGNGIGSGGGGTVVNCSAFQNTGTGIFTGVANTVSTCTAYQNTTHGIAATSGSTVSNCTAYQNTASGISVGTGCAVFDCTARLNSLDGIVCNAQSVIRANTCVSNGFSAGDGAGIHVNGADSRIEGNNCDLADRGIEVAAAGNIIIRNTCAGNATDWVIAANNVVGPIIDRRAPGSAAINGFTALSSLASTDPNANFSY